MIGCSSAAPKDDMAAAKLNFVTYNQDFSCLAVGASALNPTLSFHLPCVADFLPLLAATGTTRGFRIYHADPFSKIFSCDDGNVSIVEMLFSTSLVALVLSPRHLIIQNTKVSCLHVLP